MRRLLIAVVVLGSGVLSGCSRSTGGAITAKPTDPAIAGRFFITAGEQSGSADLYEGRFASGHLLVYRLTKTQRIGGIGGCASDLTVTNADRSVGLIDTVQHFDSGTLGAIPGVEDATGSGPTVRPDCLLALIRSDRRSNPPTDHLVLVDPAQKSSRELYAPGEGKVLGVVDWGPAGRIAAFEGTTPTEGHPTVVTGIVVFNADGSKRSIQSPVAELGNLQWGTSKWMAISDEAGGRTIFLDPDTGARSDLAGWVPLAWSPDGQRLMVTDPKTRRTLAVVDVSDLAHAKTVGHTKKTAFFDFVWLPGTATAGGPLATGRPDDGDLGD